MKIDICAECRLNNAYRITYRDIEGFTVIGECELCGAAVTNLRRCEVKPPPAFESAQEAIDTWFKNVFGD
jgi:hypothetical protein